MQGNYWTRTLATRISRRRGMAVTGATATGAAFLIACGSDDGDSSGNGTGGSSSSVVADAVDTTKSATRDGVLKERIVAPHHRIAHMDGKNGGIERGQLNGDIVRRGVDGSGECNHREYRE